MTDSLPQSFWDGEEDDAKPDYISSVIVPGPNFMGEERLSRNSRKLMEWERLAKDELEDALRVVYRARSGLAHQGIPLPASIVVGHYTMIPSGAVNEMFQLAAAQERKPKLPPLLTFERLVSAAMVGYLTRSGG